MRKPSETKTTLHEPFQGQTGQQQLMRWLQTRRWADQERKRNLQRCFPSITYDVEIKTLKLMRARLIPQLRKVTQGSKVACGGYPARTLWIFRDSYSDHSFSFRLLFSAPLLRILSQSLKLSRQQASNCIHQISIITNQTAIFFIPHSFPGDHHLMPYMLPSIS